jgi:fructose-1,6-bisphosphatase II
MSALDAREAAVDTSTTPSALLSPDGTCLCNSIVRVVEQSAMASARWMGLGDNNAADQAAVDAMRAAFNQLPISGVVVIGEGEKDEAPELYVGEELGRGGTKVEIAVDPLEGTNLTAKGLPGAISVLSLGAPGGLFSAPDIYMDKMVVGATAAGCIDLDKPVTWNLERIAEAYDRRLNELVVTVLDRERHADLIAEIRSTGARVKLIIDGDITTGISAGVQGTGDHVTVGKGGATEGVITAAAMKCLGGEIQARMWPQNDVQVAKCHDRGIDDVDRKLLTDDMVNGPLIFAATGVTSGNLLKGIQYFKGGARTNSIIMCSNCNHVRFVETIHLFTRERSSEIRL